MTRRFPHTAPAPVFVQLPWLLVCMAVVLGQVVTAEFTPVVAGTIPPTIQPSVAERGVRVNSYSCQTPDEETCDSGPPFNDEVNHFDDWAHTVTSSIGFAFGEANQDTKIGVNSINGTGYAWTILGPAYQGNTGALSDLSVGFTVPEETPFVFKGKFTIEYEGDPGFAQGFYALAGAQPDTFIHEFVGVESPEGDLEFEIQGIAPANTLVTVGIGVNSDRDILPNNNPPLEQEGEIRLEFDFSLTLAINVLVGLEVVQVVQDWENSIPLVAGKKTVVRAHIENPTESPEAIRPVLRGYRDGEELGGSPLPVANSRAEVIPPQDAQEVRGKLEENAWFELPQGWYEGVGDLELEVEFDSEDEELYCSEAAGPVDDDCQVYVTLSEVEPPDIALVGIRFRDMTDNDTIYNVSNAHLLRQLAHLDSALPVATDSIQPNLSRIALAGGTNPNVVGFLPFMRRKRSDDGCGAGCSTYYYGVLQYFGDDSGVANDAPGTHGVGYAPLDTQAVGRQTISHEIGHLLGREHTTSPTIGPGGLSLELGACCSESSGSDFPLELFENVGAIDQVCGTNTALSQGRRPTLGLMDDGDDVRVYGFDGAQEKVVDPKKFFDVMSYCSNPGIDMWPSRFTYQQLYSKLQQQPFSFPEGPLGDFYLVTGTVDYTDDSVELAPIYFIPALDPPAGSPPGSYTLRWLDAMASELGTTTFEPSQWRTMRGNHPDGGAFAIYIPADPAIHAIEVEKDALVVAMLMASANPPTVQVLAPNGGEMLSSELVEFTWDADDADGDPMFYTVQYSNDAGTTWQTIASDYPDQSLTVERGSLPAGDSSLVRVRASDGFFNAVDESDDIFSVANNAPVVDLAFPIEGRSFWDGQLVIFRGVAFDPEDGVVQGSSFQWSSSIDGPLGSGAYLEVPAASLTTGDHLLSVVVTDSDGAEGSATRSLLIGIAPLEFSDGFESGAPR